MLPCWGASHDLNENEISNLQTIYRNSNLGPIRTMNPRLEEITSLSEHVFPSTQSNQVVFQGCF